MSQSESRRQRRRAAARAGRMVADQVTQQKQDERAKQRQPVVAEARLERKRVEIVEAVIVCPECSAPNKSAVPMPVVAKLEAGARVDGVKCGRCGVPFLVEHKRSLIVSPHQHMAEMRRRP